MIDLTQKLYIDKNSKITGIKYKIELTNPTNKSFLKDSFWHD